MQVLKSSHPHLLKFGACLETNITLLVSLQEVAMELVYILIVRPNFTERGYSISLVGLYPC